MTSFNAGDAKGFLLSQFSVQLARKYCAKTMYWNLNLMIKIVRVVKIKAGKPYQMEIHKFLNKKANTLNK